MIIWFFVFSKPDGKLNVYVLDVGQGDSIYIRTPTGEDIVVDSGPNKNSLYELGKYMPIGDRTIDLLVGTHNDADHIGMMSEILDRYEISEIWTSGSIHNTDTYEKFIESVGSEVKLGATEKAVMRGDRKTFGGVSLQILAPFENLKDKTVDDENNNSIVARLDYNNFCLMLTGDAEKEEEERLISNKSDLFSLKCDILKVGHHGSSGSTSEEFLNNIDPDYAIISVAKKNKYGHPAQVVIDLLAKLDIKIYRTDTNGTIRISFDDGSYSIE